LPQNGVECARPHIVAGSFGNHRDATVRMSKNAVIALGPDMIAIRLLPAA